MLLTAEQCLDWLAKKNGGDLGTKEDAESFFKYLLSIGITTYNQITDDSYYDWIDTRI